MNPQASGRLGSGTVTLVQTQQPEPVDLRELRELARA
jgi:hypothetical protein